MSATVYDVQLSPRDLQETLETYQEKVENAQENGGELPDYPEPTDQFIAENLAAILDLEVDDVLGHLQNKNSQYEIIKRRSSRRSRRRSRNLSLRTTCPTAST